MWKWVVYLIVGWWISKTKYIDTNNRMHSLKIINASHAKSMYKYMNTKPKLSNCNANMNQKNMSRK
jgi:hypothetical protein